MKQLSVVFVVLLAMVVMHSGENFAVQGYERFLNEDYFAWLPEGLVVGSKSYDEVYRTISRLDITNGDDTQTVYDKIVKARERTGEQPIRDVYSLLMQLASKDDTCKEEMISNYLHIYALMMYKHGDGSLERLTGYMTKLGGAKFGRCAMKVEHEFDPARVVAFETKLDEFYLAALGHQADDKSDTSDYYLYGLLRGFDLTKDKFNSRKAFEVARKYNRGTSPMKVLMTFFKLKCASLRRELWLELNILNVAVSLGSHQLKSDKLMKLNEYNRICQTWSTLELDSAVRKNIQRQL